MFIVQSVFVKTRVTDGLVAEGQTSQLLEDGEEGFLEGNVVNTAEEAEVVASYLLQHMHDLDEAEDGTAAYVNLPMSSDECASYVDAFSLVTGLNLAVTVSGVTRIALAAGIVMIPSGLALGVVGFGLYRLCGRKS